jgi:hypothetical protein
MKEDRQKEIRDGVFEERIKEMKIKGWKIERNKKNKNVTEGENMQDNVEEGMKRTGIYKKRRKDA